MEKDLIIKALECCFSDGSCDGCPYTERVDCRRELERNALSLIKELTEENERLRGCVMSEEQVRNIANETIQQGIFIIKADTVRKMQERFLKLLEKEHRLYTPEDADYMFKNGSIMMWSVAERVFRQIAKEMEEAAYE